jgi:predicted component of viral defense system (DUF524 family)|tara:strand:- start:297 stop:743 length:447 start_codon:yes stop_codon:yes gene_type:complete
MNKKQFMKVITEVVRKEVQKEVKKIFIKEEASHQLADIIPEILEPKEDIKYTKNKSLNDVLNETVGLSKKQSQSDEYPTLGGGTFDSSRMSEMLGYGKSADMKRDMVAVDTIQKAGKSVDQVPKGVVDALTRDYSGLMKALDKKKGVG